MSSSKSELVLAIKQDFNNLRAANTCNICKQIFSNPVVLKTCQDVFCRDCIGAKAGTCTICFVQFTADDIDRDLFSEAVVKNINAIKHIFSDDLDDDDEFMQNVVQHVHVCTDMKRNPKGESPLHVACRRGQLARVKELINKNVDLNFKDYAGWAPMHEAVLKGNLECVQVLLEAGALVDVPGEDYSTPLHTAVSRGNVDIVRLLLKNGANISSLNYYGNSPLACAATEDVKNLIILQNSEKFVIPKYFVPNTTVVYYSLISLESITALKQCSHIKLVSLDDYINKDDCTHLIIGNHELFSNKILYAILKGIFIVEESWIDKFIESKDFMQTFKHIASNNKLLYQKSILNNLKKLPRLFDGMNFHIEDHNDITKMHGLEFTKKNLQKLIETGGGKVLHRPPALRTVENKFYHPYHVKPESKMAVCSNYILYNKDNTPQLLYNMKELQHKTSSWLIKCILQFEIID